LMRKTSNPVLPGASAIGYRMFISEPPMPNCAFERTSRIASPRQPLRGAAQRDR
jgi:hypothetical protein